MNNKSIRVRIHPNGHIIGGAHDKGQQYRDAGRAAGSDYFSNQVALGNIVIEKNHRGRIRYRIKNTPSVLLGCADELALRRAQHFIAHREGKWIAPSKFYQEFAAIYDNFVNAFKVG